MEVTIDLKVLALIATIVSPMITLFGIYLGYDKVTTKIDKIAENINKIVNENHNGPQFQGSVEGPIYVGAEGDQ